MSCCRSGTSQSAVEFSTLEYSRGLPGTLHRGQTSSSGQAPQQVPPCPSLKVISTCTGKQLWHGLLANVKKGRTRQKGKYLHLRNIDSGMSCHTQSHFRRAQSFSPALERQAFHKEREPRALNSIKQLFDSRLLRKNLEGNLLNLMGAKRRINYTATHVEMCVICLLLMAEPGRQRGHGLGRGFAVSSLSLTHILALAFPPSLAPEVSHQSGQVNSQMGE